MINESAITTTRRHRLASLAAMLTCIAVGIPAMGQKSNDTGRSETAKPKASFDNTEKDFGTVWAGADLTHTFKLTNTGNAVLHLKYVRPGCGCTIAGEYPTHLLPGESGTLPFTLKTAKLRGEFKKDIRVTTTDPDNESIRLVLRGVAKQYVDVKPYQAHFGRLDGKEPKTVTLDITNNVDKPMEITLSDLPKNKSFSFDLKELEKGKRFSLAITATPPLEPGRVRHILKLNTNLEQKKTVDIRVVATIPERLEVSPTSILLPKPKQSTTAPPVRRLRFTNIGDTPVRILEAKSDDPDHIALAVTTKVEGKEYDISVEFSPGYHPPETGKRIVLITDDAQKPTFEIPVKPAQDRRNKKQRPAEELIGRPAPDFSATTKDGRTISKATAEGKILVLDFFAGNCPHCKRQLPVVEKLRRQFEAKGVEFVMVSQTMRGEVFDDEAVSKLLTELEVEGALVTDPGNTIGPLFKTKSYPTMIIMGKTGTIEAVNIGNKSDLERHARRQLDALVAGRPVPTMNRTPQKSKRRPALNLIGYATPAFDATTIDGQAVSNATLSEHKATVLNFVAPNCGFSLKQIPTVEKVRQDYAGKGVQFVNVSEKMRKDYTADEVAQAFGALGSHIPIVHDPTNTIGQMFKTVSFPTLVLIDRAGKVHDVLIGARQDLDASLRVRLDTLIAGPSKAKPLPAEHDEPNRNHRRLPVRPGPKAE